MNESKFVHPRLIPHSKMIQLFKMLFAFLFVRVLAFGVERYTTTPTEAKYDAIKQLQRLEIDATLTVGAEASDAIIVSIQLKDDKTQNDLAVRAAIQMYLSDDANGDSIVATAPSGAVAAGTDGVVFDTGKDTKKVFMLISESDGDIDVSITEAGAKTLYMILVMPNGRLIASGAVTFAA